MSGSFKSLEMGRNVLMRKKILLSALLLLSLWSGLCLAGPQARPVLHLNVAALQNDRHVYYVALLQQSLQAAGYPVQINIVPTMPSPRMLTQLKYGELSLIWGVQTTARDRDYLGVDNRLTDGLIGQRVFMVPRAEKEAYAGVRTLDDLRALNKVGGAGEGWFEAEVWQLNDLPLHVRPGDWNLLFRMVAAKTRGVDYMIRGAHEAVIDVVANPDLVIEPHLLLVHDRDMRFYLRSGNTELQQILQDALAQADRSGLKKRLIAEYLEPPLSVLNLPGRRRLQLKTPPL